MIIGEMKVGLLDWGVWGGISDLLGDLSALSSYEDALAEAVYEELDYFVTWKVGLLGSPGGYLCLTSWDLWLSPPIGCEHLLSVHRPHVCPRLTEMALQSGRMASQSPVSPQPPPTLQESGLSLLSLNTGRGCEKGHSVCHATFFSSLGFLSDGEDNNDSRSAPSNRGGLASAGLWGGEFPSS